MNGRPDYDVGDLVVCIAGGKLRCPCKPKAIHTGIGMAKQGAVVRVGLLAPSKTTGLPLCGCLEVHDERGKPCGVAARFRKVDPLPDALTSLLASKPVRERIDA